MVAGLTRDLWALSLLLVAGCSGFIDDPRALAGDGGPDVTDRRAPRPGETPNPDLCTEVPEAPVRRLSRAEYRATMEDLFPDVRVTFDLVRDPNEHGFENRAELLNPQPLLIEQYSEVAAEVAARAIESPETLLPCDPALDGEDACGRQFLEDVGERIFRRPLTSDEVARYETFMVAERASSDFETAVQLALEAMLQSPQFLYRLEMGLPAMADGSVPEGAIPLSQYEIATRLSYLVWGSAPDAELLARARAGELATPDQREAEVRRMLASRRASDMLVEFHRQWLDFDRLYDEPKDGDRYPAYTEELSQAMREESDRFVSQVMWAGDGTLRSLLTSNQTEVNAALAEHYGLPAPPGSEWVAAGLDPSERAGILTRAGFLAGRAHRLEGSPPLRGVFVFERLLCRTPLTPPPDADLTEPASSGGGDRTNRQLFEERTSPPECAGCHAAFDGLGYAFERYDAIGQYRATDNGLPVDSTGTFTADGEVWDIQDAVDLSEHLASSEEVMSCVAGHWYDYASGSESSAEDQCRVAEVWSAFERSGGDVRELLVAFARQAAFAYRPAFEAGR